MEASNSTPAVSALQKPSLSIEGRIKDLLDRQEKYASPFLRIGISCVWLWFGINQLIYPEEFLKWVPTNFTALAPTQLVFVNGVFETLFGIFLLIGFLTRISSLILAIHLTGIIFVAVGYDAVSIRNTAIVVSNIVILLDGHDAFTVDRWILNTSLVKTRFGKFLAELIL